MKVVVYRNYDQINWSDYSLIYEGTALITENTTARDVFESLGIEVPLHVYLCFKNEQFNDKYTPVIWMSYYFDDGVLKTNFNPVDAKISELNNYGYEFDRLEFLVDTLGGIGAGGALDFLKVFDIIQNNLHCYDSFEQGIKFQKEYTLDSFTKALQLEEIRRLNNKMKDDLFSNRKCFPYCVWLQI